MGEWIPVTERLPDENDDVLIYGEWKWVSGTKYREVWLTDLKEYMHQGYKPIAWMPLPKPPKEEEEVREKYTHQTNADRIRGMTDEELADFLDRWEMSDVDYSKTFCNLCDGQYDCHDDCLMDWLKSPVEEVDE